MALTFHNTAPMPLTPLFATTPTQSLPSRETVYRKCVKADLIQPLPVSSRVSGPVRKSPATTLSWVCRSMNSFECCEKNNRLFDISLVFYRFFFVLYSELSEGLAIDRKQIAKMFFYIFFLNECT